MSMRIRMKWKKQIVAILIFTVVFLNILPSGVYADELAPETPSPVYNVVVPTSYEFTVDPNKVIDNNSMIASPEYYIINKSDIPIQLDMSFKLETKEGVVLDVKDSRRAVSSKSPNYEIWFAVLFQSKIKRTITQEKQLMTDQGNIVYSYRNGDSVLYSIDPILFKKERIEIIEEAAEEDSDKPVSSVSGSAISVSGSSITVVSPAESVSGSAISAMGPAVSASGSSISMGPVINTESGTSLSVSGSSIFIDMPETTVSETTSYPESQVNSVSGSSISVVGPAVSVSGSSITVVSPATSVSGSAISVSGSAIAGAVDATMPEQEDEASTKSNDKKVKSEFNNKKIIYLRKERGVPVTYQETMQVFGDYGDIARVNEASPNAMVLSEEWNTKSVVLSPSHRYQLMDGKRATGGADQNNRGITTFRFVGTLTTNIKWSETELKAVLKFTLNEYQNQDKDEYEQQTTQTIHYDEGDAGEYYRPEDIETGFNNEESEVEYEYRLIEEIDTNIQQENTSGMNGDSG